jgi:site-specific DNA-methyltransferase (adenine-specific)
MTWEYAVTPKPMKIVRNNNKLILGDCLEAMQDIPDKSIDMVLTDPPYGATACKWDSIIPFEPMWEQLKRVIKKNGAIVLFGSQPFTTVLINSNIKQYKATWYWQKERGTNFVQAKRYPMKVIEDCVLFCDGTPFYNPQMRKVKPYFHVMPKQSNSGSQHMDSRSVDENGNRIYKEYDSAYPINILKMARDNMSKGKSLHPTQKPVKLMEYLIKTYTLEGETVLDFTMGSGTTGVACRNLNRDFIGIEKDSIYFQIAKNRGIEHNFVEGDIIE